jgi:hypothetical protein
MLMFVVTLLGAENMKEGLSPMGKNAGTELE